ncbi:hypothetical protein HJB96_08780 [Rhizobium sp. NLR15a]|uniref:hypothetical protein n=1 Tax=Rhizobium sp. NLR15a TaxID=2731111 RepID=UPI001C82C810|nr:hypothetical protein [Rhizobium sp. NLR15a]MBX5293035.1 hypothetical protein [Rhizobium sp. NLR15a]
MTPAADPGGGAVKHVANFDLQITDDIRICGMRLLMARDGRLLTYAPTALGGRRSVTFSPETTAAITHAARNSYLELVTADDRSSPAAA